MSCTSVPAGIKPKGSLYPGMMLTADFFFLLFLTTLTSLCLALFLSRIEDDEELEEEEELEADDDVDASEYSPPCW